MKSITDLNNDCLLTIFEFFGPREWLTFSEVCKRWQGLVKEYLWKKCDKLTIYNSLNQLNQAINNRLRKSHELIINDKLIIESSPIVHSEACDIITLIGPNLKSTCLSICYYYSTDCICVFGKYLYKLNERLRFKQILEILSNKCHNLDSLKVFNVRPIEEFLWMKLINENKSLNNFEVEHISDSFGDSINNILSILPDKLETLKLHFTTQVYDFQQLLSRQLNLKNICYPYSETNQQETKLLKHVESIRNLQLFLLYTTKNIIPESWNIAQFVNLEQIILTGNKVFKNSLLNDFRNIILNLKHCINLRHVQLEELYVTQDMLDIVLSLPNLQVLHLNSVLLSDDSCNLKSSIKLKLTTLKIFFDCDCFYPNLCENIKNMPALLDLTVHELNYNHAFCSNYIFSIIETITSRAEWILIEPVKYIHNYCTKKMKIRRKLNASSQTKLPSFKLSMEPKCLECFNTTCNWLKNVNKLSIYEIFKYGF